ncbi:hypothetical protein BD408DRAFT_104492 [Parasitella parasitica]|nr:hypothetical protein BD408DRAFT_104492 [Parasitella parasitica]
MPIIEKLTKPRSNLKTEKSWWQKLTFFKKKSPASINKKAIEKKAQDWRTLSPNEPPLPFLISSQKDNNNFASTLTNPGSTSIKFSEVDRSTSELAPIFKVRIW